MSPRCGSGHRACGQTSSRSAIPAGASRHVVLYGHIRQGSALVHEGDAVKAGQPIARVGNSGASGLPHLHFTLDMPVFATSREGGWISIPWSLRGFRVVEAGGDPCDFEVQSAHVQQGWVMQFPEHD